MGTWSPTQGGRAPGRLSFLCPTPISLAAVRFAHGQNSSPTPAPSIPRLPVLLQGPFLPGACSLTAHQAQSPSAPGLLGHPSAVHYHLLEVGVVFHSHDAPPDIARRLARTIWDGCLQAGPGCQGHCMSYCAPGSQVTAWWHWASTCMSSVCCACSLGWHRI